LFSSCFEKNEASVREVWTEKMQGVSKPKPRQLFYKNRFFFFKMEKRNLEGIFFNICGLADKQSNLKIFFLLKEVNFATKQFETHLICQLFSFF